jgi:DNA helicase-2/ATP-dependent DNA helicase PcrA
LAASVIATTLESGHDAVEITRRLLQALRDHIRGRKGNSTPSQQQLELAGFVEQHLLTGLVRGSARKALLDGCSTISAAVTQRKFTGDPGEDWLVVRNLFRDSASAPLQAVADDAKYLRLLHRGSTLRSRLSELWRSSGTYDGAASAVSDALLQEHFAIGAKDWKGVHVMTIHKSKGKEFDEVIVYEGKYQHRIVAGGASAEKVAEARRNLRVAITRAKRKATLLTPRNDRCILL